MWQDVMFALKGMRKSPRVSLTVLLTLALGIGANSAIFSIVNAALLRPLPYHEPGQLVQLNADERGVGSQNLGFSYPELQDLSDRAGIFDGVSVSWQAPANLTGGEHPERVEFLAVSPNYFSILGSHPQLGRLFDSRVQQTDSPMLRSSATVTGTASLEEVPTLSAIRCGSTMIYTPLWVCSRRRSALPRRQWLARLISG